MAKMKKVEKTEKGKEIDYEKIGLKFGIEIHQRLATKNKLFCNCLAKISSGQPIKTITRKMRAVAGELGEVDPAASFEFLRNRNFVYQVFPDAACLVELDEEPPHAMNQEAIETCLEIALMLKCDMPEEIEVMRKTVIDGSNTSGFQRTAVIGLNGSMKYKGKKIRMQSVCLEEESAGIVEATENSATYRLDRLGIPLVEISTDTLDGLNPEDAKEIAYKIGILLRSTGKCMRGIGTIRQDLNVSISGGSKVEIKGVQSLDLIDKIIENEASRQARLLEIKKELKSRGCKLELFEKPRDATEIFIATKSKILQKILQENGKIFCVKLPKFGGLLKTELCPGKTFGKELSEYAFPHATGMIHSDENLKTHNLEEELEKLKILVDAELDDCIAIIAQSDSRAVKACSAVLERCKTALMLGVPKEVRVSNSDGTSKFLRPLPGSARMYPETDVPPFKVDEERIIKIKRHLPESWENKRKRFLRAGLGKDLTDQIIRSEYLMDFENLIRLTRVPAKLIASILISTLKDLRRDEIPIENITESRFVEIFRLIESKKIGKEAVPKILSETAKNPDENIASLVQKLGLVTISKNELEQIIKNVIQNNKGLIKKEKSRAVKKLMGIVMSEVRGKIDGKVVNDILKKELKKSK